MKVLNLVHSQDWSTSLHHMIKDEMGPMQFGWRRGSSQRGYCIQEQNWVNARKGDRKYQGWKISISQESGDRAKERTLLFHFSSRQNCLFVLASMPSLPALTVLLHGVRYCTQSNTLFLSKVLYDQITTYISLVTLSNYIWCCLLGTSSHNIVLVCHRVFGKLFAYFYMILLKM